MAMRMFRFRLRLTTLLVGMVFIGLILALLAQKRTYELRVRALDTQLGDHISKESALKGMSGILSDRGIDILKQSTDAELLQVFRASNSLPSNSSSGSVVMPAGVHLGEAVALRMACVLLDYRNYRYIGAGDMPDPQFGLRYRGGSATLDVLVDAIAGATDQHFWIEIRDESGKVVHTAGPHCMDDPDLQKLAASLRSH